MANATVLLGLAIAKFVVVKSMANTTVLRGLAIAKFVVVETVANTTVRHGPAPAEFVIIKRPAGASVPRALRDAIARALARARAGAVALPRKLGDLTTKVARMTPFIGRQQKIWKASPRS